jgi:uncharacterized protein
MSNLLFHQIQEDMKNAMRAREAALLGTIRLLIAAIKQREIDERITLDDGQIIATIIKMIKQRNDSIEQYQKGNRQDLADKEIAEITVLKKYMPQALTEAEINNVIKEAVLATGATSVKDMARVMTEIKAKTQGRADMGKVGAEVRNILGNQG